MRKCFEFSAGVRGKMHKFPDAKAMFEFCDMRREEGKNGFLVRAERYRKARHRINSMATKPSMVDNFYIL